MSEIPFDKFAHAYVGVLGGLFVDEEGETDDYLVDGDAVEVLVGFDGGLVQQGEAGVYEEAVLLGVLEIG